MVSTGTAWVFALVSLFGIGVLYIVFEPVFSAYLLPQFSTIVNDDNVGVALDNSTKAEINSAYSKYMDIFRAMPFILFFVVVIFMIVTAIRKERESEFT